MFALASKDLSEVEKLKSWIESDSVDPSEKISEVRHAFERLEVRQKAEMEMDKYFRLATEDFQMVRLPESKKEPLSSLAERLMVREV